MKVVLVTSDITYVPDNYNDVLEHVVQCCAPHLAGVMLITIPTASVAARVPYLYAAGCTAIAGTLSRNMYDSWNHTKQHILRKAEVPCMSVHDINDAHAKTWLKSIEPDVLINMRARCIYKKEVLGIPRLGCINVHHGLLPQQIGLFCDVHAMANDLPAGFTIHTMTHRIDDGSILYQEVVPKDARYMRYLATVASKEKEAIIRCIEYIVRTGKLPNAITTGNDSDSIKTSTPTFKTIKEYQRKGMIL